MLNVTLENHRHCCYSSLHSSGKMFPVLVGWVQHSVLDGKLAPQQTRTHISLWISQNNKEGPSSLDEKHPQPVILIQQQQLALVLGQVMFSQNPPS